MQAVNHFGDKINAFELILHLNNGVNHGRLSEVSRKRHYEGNVRDVAIGTVIGKVQ